MFADLFGHHDLSLRWAVPAQAIPAQSIRRYGSEAVCWVHRLFGTQQDAVADISGQNGPVRPDLSDGLHVSQQHGGAIGLVTKGRGRTPHRQRCAAFARANLALQQLIMLGFTKKIGLVGGEQVNRHLKLCCLGFIFQNSDVILKPRQSQALDPWRKARLDQGLFGVVVGQPSSFIHDLADFPKCQITEWHGCHD